MNTRRLARIALTAVSLLATSALLGQGPSLPPRLEAPVATDGRAAGAEEMQEFRKYLKAVRKQTVAAQMELTDGEAERFWPVYDQFAEELVRIDVWKAALTRDYMRQYRALTDRQAEAFLEQRALMEQAAIELRLKYVPLFRKVLPGKSTALFFQIEWRLNLMIELQWAAEIPLIDPSGYDPASQWRVLPSEHPL